MAMILALAHDAQGRLRNRKGMRAEAGGRKNMDSLTARYLLRRTGPAIFHGSLLIEETGTAGSGTI